MHQSPLRVSLTSTALRSHSSPVRNHRCSSSPGHQGNIDNMPSGDFGPMSDAAFSCMTKSYIGGATGSCLSGSSASLSPYHHNCANRTAGPTLASNKAKSLSLLTMERGSVEFSSGHRRLPTVAGGTVQHSRERTAAGTSAMSLSYDRDQSLDRHVDRRRQRSRDSSSVGAAGHYHTIDGYTRDHRGSSIEREYPHMGAKILERGLEQHSLIRSRSIDPEFISGNQAVFTSDDSSRRVHDPLVIELQSQISELNHECAVLQRDLEITRDKLSSSMNSVRTFWSPELKRERTQRKDESGRLGLLVEQLRMAEVENKQHLDTIQHLERENHSLRDLTLSASGTLEPSTDLELDASRKERDRCNKELKLLKRTIEEMELRIETQKQTLATRDESIRKLMDMLQAKGHIRISDDNSDEVRHIRQLEQLLEQKDSEMDSRTASLEKELMETRDELLHLKSSKSVAGKEQVGVLKNYDKHLKEKLEQVHANLLHREADVKALQTKIETLEHHHEDDSRHVSVLRQQITAKEEQNAMLQSDLDMLRDRLHEKDDIVEKKSKQLIALQMDKKRLELEVAELVEQLSAKDKEIIHLHRTVENLEDTLKEKDALVNSTKAKLASLQADHSASGDTLSGLEDLLADKDKQIEWLKNQKEQNEHRFEEEIELTTKKSAQQKSRIDALQAELVANQSVEFELREEISRLKSERLSKEANISRLETNITEKDDQVSKLHMKLRQVEMSLAEHTLETSSEIDAHVAELRKEIESYRTEAVRVKVESSHLSAALRDAETQKQSKDRQICEFQEKLGQCHEKILSLTEQLERKALQAEEPINAGGGPEDVLILKSVLNDRDERISELEDALRESIRITAQREVLMAEQQMKLDHTERMMESLQEELETLRKMDTDLNEQLTKAKNELSEKDEGLRSLQVDSKKQLVEVYEMKQEAILAAISEKDAHIAVLEMAPNKKTENIEEVEKLTREKLKLQQVLKDLTQSRMKLLQNRHQRSQSHDGSATGFYRSDSYEKLFQKVEFGTYFVYHNELLIDDDTL